MLNGYRTYASAVAMVGLAAAQFFGVAVPQEVWMILGAAGLGFLRAAIPKA